MTDAASRVGSAMSESQRRSLLESKGHGVLSMGVDDRGYGFPISYAFDPEADRIFMAFANTDGNTKREFANDTQAATLNVYEFEDVDKWWSVIVSGTIHQIAEPDIPDPPMAVFFMEAGEDGAASRIANIEEFDREWYELRIEEISGRHSG